MKTTQRKAGRPKKDLQTAKSERVTIKVTPPLKKQLDQMTKEENRTVTDIITESLETYIKRKGIQQKLFE